METATNVTDSLLPTLHDAQIEIATDQSRFKVVAAGRRFGKGMLGVAAAFKYASRGAKCRWIAPSYASDSYQAGWRLASALAKQIPGVITHLQKREFNFEGLNGGSPTLSTAPAPDSRRGGST